MGMGSEHSVVDEVVIVLTNLPSRESATKLAFALVESRQVACVNIVADIESIYRWQGKVEQTAEVQVAIKTLASAYRHVEATIRERHPYELPEIIAVPVVAGLDKYLQWVATESRLPSRVEG
ncbi:MAG: divalent-cation tolerance protein CutA [Burkholderiales bacterium]